MGKSAVKKVNIFDIAEHQRQGRWLSADEDAGMEGWEPLCIRG
jgi:hypothetical protein